MSKAHDPHWRYVAFRIDAETPLSRRAVGNAILGRARREDVPDDEAPQLTRYAWPHGIVRVPHHQLAAARDWLPRVTFAVEAGTKIPLTLETLSSSGTLKALTTRLGILTERGVPPALEAKRAQQAPRKPRNPQGPRAPPRRRGAGVPPPRRS